MFPLSSHRWRHLLWLPHLSRFKVINLPILLSDRGEINYSFSPSFMCDSFYPQNVPNFICRIFPRYRLRTVERPHACVRTSGSYFRLQQIVLTSVSGHPTTVFSGLSHSSYKLDHDLSPSQVGRGFSYSFVLIRVFPCTNTVIKPVRLDTNAFVFCPSNPKPCHSGPVPCAKIPFLRCQRPSEDEP